MTLNLIVQLATVASVLVTAVTIWITGKLSRRQMNAQLFTTYTQRYENIMSSYPEDALPARFNSDTSLPPESEKLTLHVLRHLNLISEEYYLWQRKYIDKAVWRIWESEIRRTLNTPLMRREWTNLEREFTSYPEFSEFVEKAQAQSGQLVIRPAQSARQGWDAQFQTMAQADDDRLLDGESLALTAWEAGEWEW